MTYSSANEADVREDIASPLLEKLGYKRGTDNEILREYTLKYDRHFLGRKKNNDPPLRGRADYVLSVCGVSRWILEVKSPSEDITQDTIEQAISYVRHPEVSGYYAAILNGRNFVLFKNTQQSNDEPLIQIEVTTVDELANSLRGTLSPDAIRRDCQPPIIDLGRPLAEGYRSSASISGGEIIYSNFEWDCNIALPEEAHKKFDDTCRKLDGYKSHVVGGCVWRDDYERIKARLDWSVPHQDMLPFVHEKGLMEFEYVSLDNIVSTDENRKTIFDIIGSFVVEEGEQIYSVMQWKTIEAETSLSMTLRGQAVGYIQENNFIGDFESEYEMRFPHLPGIVVSMYGAGSFTVQLIA